MYNVRNINTIDKSDFVILVKHKNADEMSLITIAEGAGDNLEYEDIANGIVDYINYCVYTINKNGDVNEYDGGMLMLTTMYCDMDTHEIINEVITGYEENPAYDYKIAEIICLPDTVDAESVENKLQNKNIYASYKSYDKERNTLCSIIRNSMTS